MDQSEQVPSGKQAPESIWESRSLCSPASIRRAGGEPGFFSGRNRGRERAAILPGRRPFAFRTTPHLGGQSLYRDHKNRSGGLDKILIPLIFKDGETEKFPVAGSESAEAKMRPVSERLSRMANSSFPPPNETKS